MSNLQTDNEIIEIKETNLKRMVSRISKLERKNSKTNELGDKQMKIEIQSIIEEEAKKCY